MNDKFESQKETLLSIKQEISLLYQQVNYLLRNEKPLELLDLDVLMNRTHTLYDQLCSINVGDGSLDEDLPFDADDLAGLFGGMTQDEPVVEEPQHEPESESQPKPVVEAPVVVEPEPATEKLEEPTPDPEPVVVEEPKVEPEPEPEDKPLGDDFGVFFRFENASSEENLEPEEPKVEPVESSSKVVHVMEAIPEEEIPERDRVNGEDLVKDNPLEMPKMDVELPNFSELDDERQGAEQVPNFFEPDDADFELATGDTLGEKMMGEDHSLAARLQQGPVHDLKSAIGINDKFLFVNELFGGSMEKYNKSIENLNDLKTLNGAMIYLNELKIELSWNSSNEAYQKLRDMVSHKFD